MTSPAADASAQQLLEQMHRMSKGTLHETMGIEVVEATPDRVVARMPVAGNTQPFGLLHGGASGVLAESIGSIGSTIHAQKMGKIAVGIELNASHHRAASKGWVTGIGTPLAQGGSLATWQIVVSDDDGKKICTARLTCMLRDAPPGS